MFNSPLTVIFMMSLTFFNCERTVIFSLKLDLDLPFTTMLCIHRGAKVTGFIMVIEQYKVSWRLCGFCNLFTINAILNSTSKSRFFDSFFPNEMNVDFQLISDSAANHF